MPQRQIAPLPPSPCQHSPTLQAETRECGARSQQSVVRIEADRDDRLIGNRVIGQPDEGRMG